MSLKQGNKKIVTDGLAMCLDAANLKSYGPTEVEYLIVGGGGAGGEDIGGGGGAGGFLTGFTTIEPDTSYTITIGTGGAGGRTSGEYGGYGNSGSDTTAFGLTAYGGGGGGGESTVSSDRNGRSGGSGGGGGYSSSAGGLGTSGQGNDGGSPYTSYGMGGGGGAGSTGENGTSTASGNGGHGKFSNIDGNNYYYAAGGGGGGWSGADTFAHGGDGGFGGGGGAGGIYNDWRNPGAGGIYARNAGSAGQATTGNGGNAGANTGSGGGAAGESNGSHNSVAGSGGSGIVIIRYAGPQKASGGTITSIKGYTIHTFTSSGTFATGVRWTDIVDNSNYGTNLNITYSSVCNGSLSFNGTSSTIIIPTVFTSYPFTVSVWCTHDSNWAPGSLMHELVNMNIGGQRVSLGITGYWSVIGPALMYGGTSHWTCPNPSQTGSSDWHNITWVVYGSNNSSHKIFIDGVSQTMTDNGGAHGGTPGWNIGSNSTSGEYWPGKISTVNFYNRTLSNDEVLQNFNALKWRFGL